MRPNSRERILNAAAQLFLKKGLEKTTTADIAKAANLSQPAVYVYFKDKMDLMKSVCLWSAEKGRAFIDQHITASDPAGKRFEAYVSANLKFFNLETAHAHSIMATYYFSLTHAEIKAIFEVIQKEGVRRIELFIHSGNHEGAWQVSDVSSSAANVHSLLIGECYRAVYSVKKKDLPRFSQSTWVSVLKLMKD